MEINEINDFEYSFKIELVVAQTLFILFATNDLIIFNYDEENIINKIWRDSWGETFQIQKPIQEVFTNLVVSYPLKILRQHAILYLAHYVYIENTNESLNLPNGIYASCYLILPSGPNEPQGESFLARIIFKNILLNTECVFKATTEANKEETVYLFMSLAR